jgi:hypothetical protein
MAAILHLTSVRGAPAHGDHAAVDTIARLNRAIQTVLDGRAGTRPILIRHWLADAEGRLSCHWDVDLHQTQVPPD